MPSNSDRYIASRRYKSRLTKTKRPFPCPLCKVSVFHTKFEDHCRTKHEMKPRRECVWCLGDFTWPSGQKYLYIDRHILTCWRDFKLSLKKSSSQPPPPPPPENNGSLPSELVLLQPKHLDAKMSPFDHNVSYLPPRAHDFPCPAELDYSPIPYRDETLNLANACVRFYLDSPSTFEWYHVSVRIPAYTRFLEVMEHPDSRCFTFPFGCWCDGGMEPEAKYRQHRHMIVGCRVPKHFKDGVWNTIKVSKRDKPPLTADTYHSRFYKEIENAFHLVNLLIYVSQRQSRCNFSGDKGPQKNNHFYLAESLPREYAMPLVLQWDNGLRQLLHQQCRNLNKEILVRARGLHLVGARWCLKIRDIPGIELGTVLPVDPMLDPCAWDEGIYVLNLMDRRRLHFKLNGRLDDLSPPAWLQRQAERGHALYHAVGDLLWFPSPGQQELISTFKPIVDRNEQLEARVVQLERRNAQLETSKGQLELENEQLKHRNGQLVDRNEQLEERNEQLEARVEQMEGDVARWKNRCEEAEQHVQELLLKINRMNEAELERLRRAEPRVVTLQFNGCDHNTIHNTQ